MVLGSSERWPVSENFMLKKRGGYLVCLFLFLFGVSTVEAFWDYITILGF